MQNVRDLTPEETVAESRELVNARIRELQREMGIYVHSDYDLPLGPALDYLRALTVLPWTKPLQEADRELIRNTRWHDASLLAQYLDINNEEYRRDSYQNGVYILFELWRNKLVPLFVEALPRYVGMSTVLSERLKQHAYGNSIPGELVTKEYLQSHCTETQRADYAVADRQTQREIRKSCMDRRRLQVRTTHTDDKDAADRLERAMIRFYESRGYELWNHIKYSTGT